MNKHTWIQVFKIGIGSAIAIYIARQLELSYATSAGIVTLLTLQNTRKDTFQLAVRRILSFLVTIVITYVCKSFIPIDVVSFGVFMLALVAISYRLDWNAAISVNAVIGTHVLLSEPVLTWELVYNEAAMVMIGIIIAVIFNMRMPSKEIEVQIDIGNIDQYLIDNLHSIADHICNHAKLNKDKKHLKSLLQHINKAIDKAYVNRHNTLRSHSDYYINYLELRKEQCEILLHVYYIVAHHDFVLEEANVVAEIIRDVADHLYVKRELGMLKTKIYKTTREIIYGEMPKNHEEFQTKAVLYQLLNEMREFMWHQEEFVNNVTEEQILAYWV